MKAILNNGITAPPRIQSHDWMMGPTIKALCALAGGAMAIVGLSGSQPFYMATIAAIVVGASFIFGQGAIATQAARLFERMGLMVPMFAGAAGVIAGMVALLGISDVRAVDIAAIVFGLALIFNLFSMMETGTMSLQHSHNRLFGLLDEVVRAIQAPCGLAILVLGILAFVGINRLNLTLIALLITAASQLLGSAARISMVATQSGER